MDVCQSDGNLLASGGDDQNIKIFDKRESRVVINFDAIHSSKINYGLIWINPYHDIYSRPSQLCELESSWRYARKRILRYNRQTVGLQDRESDLFRSHLRWK